MLISVVARLDRELPNTRGGERIAAKVRVDGIRARGLVPMGRAREHGYLALVVADTVEERALSIRSSGYDPELACSGV